MPREIVYRWACVKCGASYESEKTAQECEDGHQTEGVVVAADGFNRKFRSTPRYVSVEFADGQLVAYRKMRTQPEVEEALSGLVAAGTVEAVKEVKDDPKSV